MHAWILYPIYLYSWTWNAFSTSFEDVQMNAYSISRHVMNEVMCFINIPNIAVTHLYFFIRSVRLIVLFGRPQDSEEDALLGPQDSVDDARETPLGS